MTSRFTLFELHQFIRRVFYLNFEEAVWIEAEISESREHNGHYYLSLIEKNESGGLVAKASASLWRNKAAGLKHKYAERFAKWLRVGNKVRIYCTVEFHPRYGYSLIVEDFDPDFTEGFLFAERKKTIARLEKEGLTDRNRELPLPSVIKRIAVISSPSAAGYQDFMHQLTGNSYGYWFHTDLFASPMQGDQVKTEFPKAMAAIREADITYDIIVIVRGGGAAIDLTDFDDYEVAASIALSPYPVIAGIGHERDSSVADMVSAFRVKTPTAAAEYILENNLNYELAINNEFSEITRLAADRLNRQRQELERWTAFADREIRLRLLEESQTLDRERREIRSLVQNFSHREQLDITRLLSFLSSQNPYEIMKKGYAMIFQDTERILDLSHIRQDQPVILVMNKDKLTINEKRTDTPG